MQKNEASNLISDLNKKSYIGRRVQVVSTYKSNYADLVGKKGTVKRESSGSLGVLIDGKYNPASAYGVFWFGISELKFLNDKMEDDEMKDFEYVAIVNLLEDYHKKDYAFALYESDYNFLTNMAEHPAMVVVNARGKNNCILGTVNNICSAEDYYKENKNAKITAEVVGVVNMDNYIARENEKVRLEELAKKKAAIERELEAEINKRKSVEYYEEMAKRYSDNPKLAELVAELKGLGE